MPTSAGRSVASGVRLTSGQDYAHLCGAILGVVELVDCVRDHDSPWAMPDSWHWVLSSPRPLVRPIPYRGALGLWRIPAVTIAEQIEVLQSAGEIEKPLPHHHSCA